MPPAPQGLNVVLSTNGNSATISWVMSPGNVTGYLIYRQDHPWSGFEVLTNVSPNQTSFVDLNLPDGSEFKYLMQAQYGGGNSALSPDYDANTQSDYTTDAWIVREAQGRPCLVVSNIPRNVSALRVQWSSSPLDSGMVYPIFGYDINEEDLQTINSSPEGSIVIPITSLTNGVYTFNASELPLYEKYDFQIQALGTDGKPGRAINPYPYGGPSYRGEPYIENANIPFLNGSTQIVENVKFLLRVAQTNNPFFIWNISHWPDNLNPGQRDYVFAGFHYRQSPLFAPPSMSINEFQPFEENAFYRNFCFDINLIDNLGFLSSGVGSYVQSDIDPLTSFLDPSTERIGYGFSSVLSLTYRFNTAQYVSHTNTSPTASLLSDSASQWIYSDDDAIGWNGFAGTISGTNTALILQSNVRNIYGLKILSVKWPSRQRTFPTITPGTVIEDNLNGSYFAEIEQPTLQTVGYFFGRLGIDPVPGDPTFNVTNSTPSPIIIPVGKPFSLTAWAKKAISNGYTNKFAYAEQYFDKAYKIDANGNVTTNETGILSPYGEFFPTEPGKVALVTMPDIDNTNQCGTGVVNVIKLQLDVNHDGVMDQSFAGPDNTSADRPFRFWANNDYDRLHDVDCSFGSCDHVEDDLDPGTDGFPLNSLPDSQFTDPRTGRPAIPSLRDLEDYTRLWASGLSNVMAIMPTNYTVKLVLTGDAQLRIFRAYENDGGTNYLFDAATASSQVAQSASLYLGLLTSDSSITLSGGTNLGEHFIFCGAQTGSAEVDLQILDGNQNFVADAPFYIEIKDIKQMYERWTVGDEPLVKPAITATSAKEGVVLPFQYLPPTDNNTPYILLVHGWNMKKWEKDRFAEAAFKRLYWQGYQGRFGIFRWPTGNGITDTLSAVLHARNYDNSEFTAWTSATGLLNKLTELNMEYPGNVYLMAHSMGNVVAGEALRLAGTNHVVNTYVAMQAAVSAHAYDPGTPTWTSGSTPDIYANYWTNGAPCYFNGVSGTGSRADFYNTNDFALNAWLTDQYWKPDHGISSYPGYWYSTPGTTHPSGFYKIFGSGANDFSNLYFPTDSYVILAYCVQSRSYCLGATASASGFTPQDLSSVWPGDTHPELHGPYSAHFWHSAEFRANNMEQNAYWNQLLQTYKLINPQ
ncbi:Fibronectin type III domain protein [Pedosphaera parvula Ellin514]|uniref:Fibronectin type III domain protein n=2 Tax=Pedosphaera TaxID=1032526 RepID=B9XPC0_PEDPL|nr:Fibronectin type III domain protein [Pedosphaera parvula Ellin514]